MPPVGPAPDGQTAENELPASLRRALDPPGWNGKASALVARIGAAQFSIWFGESELDGLTLTVSAPFKRDWINNHFRTQLAATIGGEVNVRVRTQANGPLA